MTKQIINVGTSPNDNRGDSLRAAFQKINANFTELYSSLGLNVDGTLNIGAFEFVGSTMSTTDSSSIVIDQATTITSNLTVGGDILPARNLQTNLGSLTNKFHSLYVGTGSVYIGDARLSLDNGTLNSSVGFATDSLTIGGNVLTVNGAGELISTGGIAGGGGSGVTSYNDLTNKPTIPTSFDKLVSGSAEVVLITAGPEPFTVFPAISTNDQLQIVGSEVGAVSGNLVLVSQTDTVITSNGAGVGGNSHSWTFGSNGALTIPSDIRSDSNINIEINLGDSTLRRWSFGEDGALTFPDGTNQPTAWTNTLPAPVDGDGVDGSANMVFYAGPDWYYTSKVGINPASGMLTLRGTDGAGGITFPDNTIQTTAYTGSVGNLRSESNINVDINLTDSTLRRWQFGEDGHLTLPTGGDIKNSAGASVLGGGAAGPVQEYLELTNTPFIIRPVVLGSPVTVSTPGDGAGAQLDIVIDAGPVITSITVTTPGTGYIVEQRYRVWHYQINGSVADRDSIDFDVATVGAGGELLTITNAAFVGAADVSAETYSNVNIELRASPGDAVGPGLTLVRGRQGALFNILAETEYNQDTHAQPTGTEWNSDGWSDLSGLAQRTYTTLYSALNGAVGNYIVGAELVMHDTINDKYYKFSFSNWGGNNGGSFAYTRTLVEDPNYFRKLDYATANNVDVIEDDSTLQIGITRGNNQGIYNPFTEQGWNNNVSPQGTLWNIDGWQDLTNVETRTYDNFNDAYNGNLGNNVPGSRAVMYVPSIDKYYAVEWLGWTQNAQGGGFSYLRYELDLTQLQQGITFADGTVLNSAEGIGRVKLTAPGDRRIEEVAGYKQVAVTSRTTGSTITTTAFAGTEGAMSSIQIAVAGEELAALTALYNGDLLYTIQISLDEDTWIPGYLGGGDFTNYFQVVFNNGATLSVTQGDTVYYRLITGGDSVTWWNSADLPGGSGNFRGAVIDYHAYTGDGTWIGTIHIVDDDGDEHITHTEVSSGGSDMENDDLWLVQNEGQIRYRRIDGESATLRIQWTAKVFYGSEIYD